MKRKKYYKHKKTRAAFLLLFFLLSLPFLLSAIQITHTFISKGQSPQNSVSDSKLGVFALGISQEAKKVVAAGPRVIKVMDPQSNREAIQLVRDYKRTYPEGIVIMRVYEGAGIRYSMTDDPVESAERFWKGALKPAVNKLSPGDRRLIDYLSGTNGNENTPDIDEPGGSEWFGRFWARLAELISEGGFRPNVGEIYVGHPDVNNLEGFVPALQKIKETGGILSMHGYTLEYTTDPEAELFTSLRYRDVNNWLKNNHPELANLPIVLTEGGVDDKGDPKKDGWNGDHGGRGNRERYIEWLKWYDNELKHDSYVLGTTLFQIGDSHWSSFNLDPIADWLTDYIGQGRAVFLPTMPVKPVTNIPPSTTPLPIIPTAFYPTVTPIPTQIIPSPTMPRTIPTSVVIYQKIVTLPDTLPTLIPTPSPTPVNIGKVIGEKWFSLRNFFENILRIYLP
ncbi:MAG: APHP domain protein [Candidatus Gottesmanbacteria bacterium GW2011_GWC2_39_8]|uniref:APHP domain protein n=1 Tax=Candidatus Gottesmanbacteria bacterium GW2011_GWC2_39_8 TaxID=1618450 RepID=A0A0G0Q1G9_9BACT|nr:MAG: APHP domain protein [Candidatus Gottesmanbacteria bacterium GW2011_GWC2_39_8]